MSTSDDLEAIDQYFRSNASKPGANNEYQSWRTWYDNLSFWDKNLSSAETKDGLMNQARARRDRLNTAIGQPDLRKMGYVPVEDRPVMTAATVAKTFAGGGAPPTIKLGSRGAPVSKVQQFLKMPAPYPTSNFDKPTDAAVKLWQKAKGLTDDGVVGPKTWESMGVRTVTDITAPPGGLRGLTAPASGGANPTIVRGMSGPDVARWQVLIGLSPADGEFGPLTETKTKEFQATKGIDPDGVVGPLTWAAATAPITGAPTPVPIATSSSGPAQIPPAPPVPPARPVPPSMPTGQGSPSRPRPIPQSPPITSKPSTPKTPQPGTPVPPTTPQPPVKQAGIFGTIGNLPTAAKIAGGVFLGLGLVTAMSGKKEGHHGGGNRK